MTAKVAIIDYGSGNLRSAAKAIERAGSETGGLDEVRVTDNADDVAWASHIVLPGVGAFADCRKGLYALPDMAGALQQHVIEKAKPFLGICVGMQLMATLGREFETTSGLGWIDGEVGPIKPSDLTLKIPHMGWNNLDIIGKPHVILEGINSGDHGYFVHSYAMTCTSPDTILATVDYGGPVVAVVGKNNLVGTQFHPEKSQKTGLRLLSNFVKWRP